MSNSRNPRCTVQKAFSRAATAIEALVHIHIGNYGLYRVELVVFGMRDSSLHCLDCTLSLTITFGVIGGGDSVED